MSEKKLMPGKLIPIYYDRCFKYIFQKYSDYRNVIISKILKDDSIFNMHLTNTEVISETGREKTKTTDLIFTDEKNYINLEMEHGYKTSSNKLRNFIYLASIAKSSISQDDMYLLNTIFDQIVFADKPDGEDDGKLIYEYVFMENELHYEYPINFKIYVVRLDKIDDDRYTKGVDEKLISYLKMFSSNDIDMLKKLATDKTLKEVLKGMVDFASDKDNIGVYVEEEDRKKLERSSLYEMKQEGIKEGIKQGIKEGVKQGIKEGSKQTQNEIAKNLLQAKVSEEIIIETTGITKEELDNLKN